MHRHKYQESMNIGRTCMICGIYHPTTERGEDVFGNAAKNASAPSSEKSAEADAGSELLRCPHCGSSASIRQRTHGDWSVECERRFTLMSLSDSLCPVNSRTRSGLSRDEAIAAWNTRAPLATQDGGVPFPGMANLYHAITGKECAENIALGMATSAVSSLLHERDALKAERDRLRAEVAELEAELKFIKDNNYIESAF